MASARAAVVGAMLLVACGCTRASPGGVAQAEPVRSVPPAAVSALVSPSVAMADASTEASTEASALASPTDVVTLAGRFAFDVPRGILRARTGAGGVRLVSSAFEDYNDGHFPFEVELRLAPHGVVEAAKRSVRGGIFAGADESSFQEGPDAERAMTRGGWPAYSVVMGVEGIGQVDTFVAVGPKETLHVTCHYCCGLVESPKLPMAEQLAVCDAIVRSIRPAGT